MAQPCGLESVYYGVKTPKFSVFYTLIENEKIRTWGLLAVDLKDLKYKYLGDDIHDNYVIKY